MTGKWLYYGDVNRSEYGGTDMRHVRTRLFQFIELTNMDEARGRDNEGRARYVVELSHVDLDALSPDTIRSALDSCGHVPSDTINDAARAEMCKQ
jgi:hypothetical protein